MRKIMIIACLLPMCSGVMAQNFNEWFRQKKTQKTYLIEQIAALKIYTEYLQKGYEIAKDGLGWIGDIKNGEFKLHQKFFDGLSSLSPVVRRYPKIGLLVSGNIVVMRKVTAVRRYLRNAPLLQPNEVVYLSGVLDRLVADCQLAAKELEEVITDGQLKMSDEERLSRIDQLYDGYRDKERFLASLEHELKWLVLQRKTSRGEIETDKILQGIK